MFKAIVIDDERVAISQLEAMAAFNENIAIIAGYSDPLEGLEGIRKLQPQVVFLDISMPGMRGLYLAEQIVHAYPQTGIVFVTSHNDYALKAFELNVLDYLLKPLTQERFNQCLDKLLQYGYQRINFESLRTLNQSFKEAAKKIFVEDNGDTILLKPDDIYFFEVRDKTVFIKTKNNTYSSPNNLSYFEAKLQNSNFYRCHRAFLINLNQVSRFIHYSKVICEVGFADIPETALVSKTNVNILKRLLEY